ncbi:MAG TPA: hypothetical protein VD993_05270 [Chitinophagaceae bacterium]|nr:hypothetical protein [Chitinophagaceae bacterium]
MKCLPLTLLIAIAILVVSCQKEVNGTTDVTTTVKLVSKIHETDDRLPMQGVYYDFEYDAQQRVTRLRQLSTDSSGGSVDVIEDNDYYFHYIGADNKPFKVTLTPTATNWTWYFKYDGQGRKIQDSIVDLSWPDTDVANYTYNGNQIIATFLDAGTWNNLYRDTIFYDGTNISKQVLMREENNFLLMWWEDQFTYDNNPNPLYQLNIGSMFFFTIHPAGIETYLGLNKNNVTVLREKDFEDPTSGTYTEPSTFTYDADGYPVLRIAPNPFDPAERNVIRYEYRQ